MRYWGLFFIFGFICLKNEGQQPKLMLPIGHTDKINSAQFSPDCKKIVTASVDRTAKIWDASTGQLQVELKGHTLHVTSAQFSADGKKIVTASYDCTAKIWDAATSQLRLDLKGHTSSVTSAQFSPDCKKIVTASYDSSAKIWDATTGKLLVNLKGHNGYVNSAQFSPDGKKMVTASDDSTAKIWDAAKGQLLLNLKGHTSRVTYAQFSPDGKKIVTASSDNIAKIWDAATGQLLLDLKGHTSSVTSSQFSPDGKKIVTASLGKTAKIWDAATGQLLLDLKGHTSRVTSVQFSPDGKKMVTASWDNTAKIWDAATGQLLLDLKGHNGPVTSAQFSADGKKIVTASWDKTTNIWDAATGQLLVNLKGHTYSVTSAQFSPDNKKIVTASGDGTGPDGKKIVTAPDDDSTAKIWDATTGQLLLNLKGHSDRANSAQFSADGKKIVTASDDSTAKIWDAATGQLLLNLKGHSDRVNSAQFSPDGKKIVTASDDRTAKIWDATTGQLLSDLKGHTSRVYSAQFSPDGKKITTSQDSTAKIWDASSGQLILNLKGHTIKVNSAQFSPDGKKIVTASDDRTAKIWDATTGQLLFNLKGHTHWVYSAQFSPDSKKIVTTSNDNTCKIWNVTTGQLLFDLKGHTHSVNSAQFSPDGKNIVTASKDNTCKIWNAQTGEILYTFFAIDSTDYLVVDKDNRYDGTDAARKVLYLVCGDEVIQLDQVKDQLWVPNLAERIMKGDSINAKKLSDLNLCGLTPQVENTDDKNGFRYNIIPRRGGLGETVLFINGIETKRYKPEQLKKVALGYQLYVAKDELKDFFIAGDENRVTVKAYTTTNDISSRGIIVSHKDERKPAAAPNIYIVSIGVSNYKGDELDLKYAAKDAGDMSNALSLTARKYLNSDGREHVFVYNLNTNNGVFPEKKSIQNTLKKIGDSSKANDILLIFFAGHGVTEGLSAGQAGEKKQFYFLTADASKTTSSGPSIADVGISTVELNDWIKPEHIKAQKRILIFDACNSGQAINDLVTIRNDDESRRIKSIEKLNEKSGLIIFSASASNQSAYESGKYNQGLLTYSLLKTLKQRPDILEENRFLNISRWFDAAGESVVQLSKENAGARQDPQIFSNSNFPLGIVDDEVRAGINLSEERPLFAATRLFNMDQSILSDDLGLGSLIDNNLNDFSSRGPNPAITFMNNTSSSEAYSINGIYEITNNVIKCKINLRKNKETKNSFEITGTKSELNKLAEAIAQRETGWVKNNK